MLRQSEVIITNCKKTCKCIDCKNFQLTAIYIIDDRNPCNEMGITILGMMCTHYGVYDALKNDLKKAKLRTDIVYISDKEEYTEYIDG